MADVLLRAAKPGDISEITRIYAHAVRHGTASFELDPPDVTEMTGRYQAMVASGYPYLVAQRAGELLGFAYAGPYRMRPAYRWTVEDSIYIAPQVQRHGVGSALLRRLIELSESKGYRQMIAVIGDFSERRVCRAAPRGRLPHGRNACEYRLQVRPLA